MTRRAALLAQLAALIAEAVTAATTGTPLAFGVALVTAPALAATLVAATRAR